MKIYIVFHSLYGHVYEMAKAVAKGAGKVEGAEVNIFQVPETLQEEVIAKMGATEAKKAFADVPVIQPEMLAEADGILFGTPTRFGMMTAQMRAFLDATGGLWMNGSLIGKAGGVFTSSATQHGGQESTILNFHTTLLHHGMVIVGLPYSAKEQMTTSEMSGGSPYGASTIAGGDGSRQPSKNELLLAEAQGRHLAEIAKKLAV